MQTTIQQDGKRKAAAKAQKPAPGEAAEVEWHVWAVEFPGHGTFDYAAPSRGKALSFAMEDYAVADGTITFGRFLKLANARKRGTPPSPDGYDRVREAYGVDVRIGDTVAFRNEGPAWNGKTAKVIYPGKHTSRVRVVVKGIADPIVVHPDNIVLVERPQAA